ncbi:DNA repair exonuclease [Comamonas humi]
MPRFLHTADWQIGRQFSTFDADTAPLLAEARFAAVERLAQLATEYAVDAVLVAGDVFDAQTVSDKTIRRLFQLLAGFAGPWLLIPGNHDAALAESVWTRAERLQCVPANAHLLLAPEVRSFAERGFAVLPAPLRQRHTYDDTTAWMDTADTPAGLLRIGLAHGSVQGLLHDGIDSPNPIAPTRCDTARLDWLALGDWHGLKQVQPRMAYSGTPEPDRFPNNEPGYALLVDIAAPGAEPQVTPLPVARYRWRKEALALQLASDVDAAEALLAAVQPHDVLQLTLSGQLDWAGYQRLQAAVGVAEARARCLIVEQGALRMAPTDDDLAALHADGYVGELLAELRQQSAAGQDGAQDALALLATALWQQGAAA